jgi:hypothetical protein
VAYRDGNPTHLVYLDESGDTGFRLEAGSSPTLVVAGVLFDGPTDAQTTAEVIADYRSNVLGKGAALQFHFANLSRKERLDFLRAVQTCPFRVRAVVMHKDRIWEGTHLRQSPKHFYNFTVKSLLKHTFGRVVEAKVFIDGDAGRLLRQELRTYLRRELNTPAQRVIREVRFVPKREGNLLLQLADMVTGAIARSYLKDKPDSGVYREVLRPRLEDVWEFGRPKGK